MFNSIMYLREWSYRSFYLLLSVALLALLCSADSAFSDALQDVVDAHPEFGQRYHGIDPELFRPKWLNPDSNFGKVFLEPKGALQLLNWIRINIEEYSPKADESKLKSEFISSKRTYVSRNSTTIHMRVLLPHPKYLTTRELGLIAEFEAMEPPVLQALYSKRIMLGAHEATLYEEAQGSCSIVLKITKGAVINFSTPSCDAKEDLIEFAKKARVERLISKLES